MKFSSTQKMIGHEDFLSGTCKMRKIFAALCTFFCVMLSADDGTLRWSADPESGAPAVFYDGNDLTKLVGFETEIIEKIANIIGKKPVFCPNDWDGLISGLQGGMYDVVINGFVPDEVRGQSVLFSRPYYACGSSLIVRENDDTMTSVLDCTNTTVGVLKNSKSHFLLKNTLKSVNTATYPTEYLALLDLLNGRIDSVVIDDQVAGYYVKKMKGLKIIDNFDEMRYCIILPNGKNELLLKINEAIDHMRSDGSLEKIINKWEVNNPAFERLINEHSGQQEYKDTNATSAGSSFKAYKDTIPNTYKKMIPIFLKAAGITIVVSVSSMILAMIIGLCFATMCMYAPRWIRFCTTAIVEILRGTPLLIQLFFIFYGLPRIGITLEPMVAGIITLGINYAAFESENFRAGMLAVPYGQTEAARALGMNQWQTLRYIILPQAFSFILPPLTNDFISLLKDSSLVSLITVVELTKAYTLVASSTFNFFGTGIIVGIIYFLIGFPFVKLAKMAEAHLILEKRSYNSRYGKK